MMVVQQPLMLAEDLLSTFISLVQHPDKIAAELSRLAKYRDEVNKAVSEANALAQAAELAMTNAKTVQATADKAMSNAQAVEEKNARKEMALKQAVAQFEEKRLAEQRALSARSLELDRSQESLAGLKEDTMRMAKEAAAGLTVNEAKAAELADREASIVAAEEKIAAKLRILTE